MKQQFVKMCESLDIFKGKLIFNSYEFESKLENYELINSSTYKILSEKMENLVKLVNENPSLIECDIEEELWEKI